MRKTKIVCTLGPSTDREGVLREMIQAGMNVARFNFSHGTHAEHKVRLDALKALREELDAPVAKKSSKKCRAFSTNYSALFCTFWAARKGHPPKSRR